MKDKCFLGICFLLVVINVVGCRKKSDSTHEPQPQPQTVGSMEESSQTQAEFERVFRDKLEAKKPVAKVSTAADDVSDTQADEVEYFALFMEGKKVGYAIQSRDVEGNKVVVAFRGMCAQCTLAELTMKDVVEAKLREFVSEELFVEEDKESAQQPHNHRE